MKLHPNARTCPRSRCLAVERVEQEGWTLARAGEAAGVSVRTLSKWLRRFREEGEPGRVIDADVDVFPADSVASLSAVARDPVAGTSNAAKLLDVDVEELARPLALVAVRRLGRLEPRQLAQPDPGQHR